MPVENERKFILGNHAPLLERCRSTLSEQRLAQFYLSPEGRFRRVEHPAGADPRYLFTYKVPTPGGLLEIENDISADDYGLALGASKAVLDKSRFDIRDGAFHWSLDFLRRGEDVYFALAEVEFPAGSEIVMPEILEGHVELAVPQDDNPFFANAKLIDPAYAGTALERYRALAAA